MGKCKDSSAELDGTPQLPNLFKCFSEYLMPVLQLATTGENIRNVQPEILEMRKIIITDLFCNVNITLNENILNNRL